MSFQFDGILIGTFKIYYYGILIMLGAVAATWIASRQAKQYGQDPEIAWDLLPWALIGGIIGARLWHVLFPPASMVEQGITTMFYLTHPLDAINLRKGGLGIPGAVIGGLFAVWTWLRRSAGGAISSTRKCTVLPPICPGNCSSIRLTGCRVTRMWLITTPCSFMSSYGTWAIWRCCCG